MAAAEAFEEEQDVQPLFNDQDADGSDDDESTLFPQTGINRGRGNPHQRLLAVCGSADIATVYKHFLVFLPEGWECNPAVR